MYFSTFTVFVLSHLATVRAQGSTPGFDTLTSPPPDSSFAVGSVLPIIWEAGSSTGTVSILLNGGATPGTLQNLFVIGKSINSQAGGYNWTITPAVGSYATYGLNLTLDGNPITEYQESFPFHITGGSDTSSSSSSSVVSSSAFTSATESSSASGSTSTVTASTTSAATTTAADLTPSATGSTVSMTSSGTLMSTTSASFSNSTASKTSSSKSSSTSSASTSSSSSSSSAAIARPVQVLSASVALLSACLFAFAL